jgi:chemotaxis protein histidine kinase CheA
MTKTQVVRITTSSPEKAPLSKAQKEFNRLTQRISELDVELGDFRTAATAVQQRIRTEYTPLLDAYNQQRAALVRLLDRAYDHPESTKAERRKIAELIVDIAQDLVGRHGLDELKPILARYDSRGTEEPVEAGQNLDRIKEQLSLRYGITFDDDVDISTPEQLKAYVEEQLKNRRQAEPQQTAEERPRSAKKQAREAKRQQEQRNITKAVRTVYMDLVKTFHPDREPDEEEKARKTAIMQRVTEAYEKSDLMALFRLQLEYNRIDQTHLERLAEDQLRYYNKILKQQADELGQALNTLQRELSEMLGKPIATISSPMGLEFSFNNDIRSLKRSVKEMKREVKELSNPAYLKGWLKVYDR